MHGESLGIWLHSTSPDLPVPNEDFEPNCACMTHGHQTTISLETWRTDARPQYPWKRDALAPDHSILGNVMHWHQTTVSLETWCTGTRPQYPWKRDALALAYNILRNVTHGHQPTIFSEMWRMDTRPQYPWKHDARALAWDSHDACSVCPVAQLSQIRSERNWSSAHAPHHSRVWQQTWNFQ